LLSFFSFVLFFVFHWLNKYDTLKKNLLWLVKISHWSRQSCILSNRLVFYVQWFSCLFYLISPKALWICNWHFGVYSLDERIDYIEQNRGKSKVKLCLWSYRSNDNQSIYIYMYTDLFSSVRSIQSDVDART